MRIGLNADLSTWRAGELSLFGRPHRAPTPTGPSMLEPLSADESALPRTSRTCAWRRMGTVAEAVQRQICEGS